MEWEISPDELGQKLAEGCQLIDIRDAANIAYGMIPGAAAIPQAELSSRAGELAKGKGVVVYCTRGQFSLGAAEELRELGVEAYSLQGGYMGWLRNKMAQEEDADRQGQIEEGLRKTWHKRLFSPFAKAVKTYGLVKEEDKIAVCISGGKDSMLMAKLFQELQRHRECHFELVFLVMNPGYSEENRKIIEHNAKLLGIPITMFETRIFDVAYQEEKKKGKRSSACYLCARMRRGYLYAKAKELGCNKIALGHHYDDVIETILMGMLHSGQIQTMMPKLHSTNFEGMELIRPMYLVREDDIKRWRDANGLHFIQCACHFTDNCSSCGPEGQTADDLHANKAQLTCNSDGPAESGGSPRQNIPGNFGIASKRMETKRLIAELKKYNPDVENHIFKSVENVCLDAVIAYKQNGQRHHFLDHYDEEGAFHEKLAD